MKRRNENPVNPPLNPDENASEQFNDTFLDRLGQVPDIYGIEHHEHQKTSSEIEIEEMKKQQHQEKINPNRNYIKAVSVLSFLCVGLIVYGVINTMSMTRYKMKAEIYSQSAITEFCESLDNISKNLQKTTYANSKQMLTSLASELYRESSMAKSSLSQLTSEELESSELYKFLSQVGDYVFSLTEQNEFEISKNQKEDLAKLYAYSISLADEMNKHQSGYFNGEISFDEKVSTLNGGKNELPKSFLSSMNDTQQALADYPTLIYDGPFADSVLERDSQTIKNEKEISEKTAKEMAAKILKTSTGKLRTDTQIDSKISMYCFSIGEKSVGITIKGGYLAYLISSTTAGEEQIDEQEAIKLAKKYLDNLGYKNMVESYYFDYDGICTINFAYKKDDITYYSDLIKVSVALDTGEITSIDAHGFLMNHTQRNIVQPKYTQDQAQKFISKDLKVLKVSKAMIPKSSAKEVLCYEFHCKDSSSQEVLIYINAQTGKEEDILILLYSDDGTLTR